jgi:hypothetical protein
LLVEPWGRVEGVLKIGSKPGANQKLSVFYERKMERPGVFLDYRGGTDAEGRFVIDRMVPGDVTVGREIVLHESGNGMISAYTHAVPVEVESGQTARVTIGGTGRPVIGRARAPEGSNRRIDWTWGDGAIQRGRQFPVRYPFKLRPDGSFRAEDIPAGTYELRVEVREPSSDQSDPMGKLIGTVAERIVVPEMPGGRSDEPLDVGSFELELASGK